MSVETAERALQMVFKSPSPVIKIEFQGGEPLLNFERIQLIVLRAEEINKTECRNLQFVIATNLAVITDEILAFCAEHNILISTSLDGPEDLHNKNRPRPGRNSHQLALTGIEKVRAVLGHDRVSALMTTTRDSLPRVREIIDEYVRLNFDGIFLRALSPYGFAIKTKQFSLYDRNAWLEFYKTGLDYIIDINKRGHNFIEHYAATILTKMLTPFNPGYVDLTSPAGIGISVLVYNYDGDVYASDEGRMLAEMGDKTFRLGNLNKDAYEEIMLSDSLLDPIEQSFTGSVPMCSECAFESYCGAEPVYHHATQGNFVGRKPQSDFCHRNMTIFRDLIKRYQEDPVVADIFRRWVSR
jgi:His-Xaa-Ser system radical SAM maturase HxsB